MPSFELLPHQLGQKLLLKRGEVLLLVLGIGKQHVNGFGCHVPVIDDPIATALSVTLAAPADLPKAAGTRDDRTLFRSQDQGDLKCSITVIREKRPYCFCEDGCLNE